MAWFSPATPKTPSRSAGQARREISREGQEPPDLQGGAWRWEPKPPETPGRRIVRRGAEQKRRKGCELPPAWGRQEDNSKRDDVEKKEAALGAVSL